MATATGNPFLPVIPLQERALALLSNRAVDNVLLGVPLELTVGFLEEYGAFTSQHSFSKHSSANSTLKCALCVHVLPSLPVVPATPLQVLTA